MISNLYIQTTLRESITYLKKSFFTPPFKIADIREDKRNKTLQLMLMSSSPGVLDGDDYRMEIDLEENSSLNLQTQSYQRLFTMQNGASQQLIVRLAGGCSFSYLPHPVVPHQNSNFTSKNKFYLSDNCTLLWGEIFTCGRKLNGEEFLFSKYHALTEVFLNKKLIVKENFLIQPAEIDIRAIGQMEGYTHQGSLLYMNQNSDKKELISSILNYLSKVSEISFGISAAPANGIIMRLLGYKAEQLYSVLKKVEQLIKYEY